MTAQPLGLGHINQRRTLAFDPVQLSRQIALALGLPTLLSGDLSVMLCDLHWYGGVKT
jgi:hypothetical protein